MADNLKRSTPGRFLIVWAAMMTAVLLFAWRLQLHRGEYLWNEYPSALGDANYYSQLSDNDFYKPALRLPGHAEGYFRRKTNPVARDDAHMQNIGRETTLGLAVYQDPKKPERKYLKVAEDRYVEFGERNHWPNYQPLKAVPVALPQP